MLGVGRSAGRGVGLDGRVDAERGLPVAEEVVAEPLDVAATRAWLVAHAVPGVDEVCAVEAGGTVHRRLVPVGAGHGVLEVELGTARVAIRASGTDGAADVIEAGRRWLGLDADPAAAVAALAGDPVLGPLVAARPLVRVPGSTDPFETAVNVVLGQHVSLAAGRVFAGRLALAHGVERSGPIGYPGPEVLAAAHPDDLRAAVGVTGARARTVVAIAEAVASGLVDLAPTADPEQRSRTRAALLALPGVGPWTADLVALRCLRDPDVFLPGDLVLRRAMGGVTAREAARLAQAWAPHRSLAVVHLWTHHALDPR